MGTVYKIPVLDNSNFSTKVTTLQSRINIDPLFSLDNLLSVIGIDNNSAVQITFQNTITEKYSYNLISNMVNRIFNNEQPNYHLEMIPRVVFSSTFAPIDNNDYYNGFDPSSIWIYNEDTYIRGTNTWRKNNQSTLIFSSGFGSNVTPYMRFTSLSFTILTCFKFSGSVPIKEINIIFQLEILSNPGTFQLVDQNNSNILISGTLTGTVGPLILFTGTSFTNVPTSSTILAVNISVVSTLTGVRIYSLTIL